MKPQKIVRSGFGGRNEAERCRSPPHPPPDHRSRCGPANDAPIRGQQSAGNGRLGSIEFVFSGTALAFLHTPSLFLRCVMELAVFTVDLIHGFYGGLCPLVWASSGCGWHRPPSRAVPGLWPEGWVHRLAAMIRGRSLRFVYAVKIVPRVFEGLFARPATLSNCKWCPQTCSDSRMRLFCGNDTVVKVPMKVVHGTSDCRNFKTWVSLLLTPFLLSIPNKRPPCRRTTRTIGKSLWFRLRFKLTIAVAMPWCTCVPRVAHANGYPSGPGGFGTPHSRQGGRSTAGATVVTFFSATKPFQTKVSFWTAPCAGRCSNLLIGAPKRDFFWGCCRERQKGGEPRSDKNGGNPGKGKTLYHKIPSPKNSFGPPTFDTFPPPLCSCPATFFRGNGHRPDQSHFLRRGPKRTHRAFPGTHRVPVHSLPPVSGKLQLFAACARNTKSGGPS